MAETPNRRTKSYPRPLGELVGRTLGDIFARQGFASSELLTHWPDIVGADIAAYAEPVKLQWPRRREEDEAQPATLVLRVEGPAAIEIQHMAPVVLERVNRFLGWRAVGRLSYRQAPITRRTRPKRPEPPAPAETASVAAGLGSFEDAGLKDALARLGAAVRRG